MPVEMCDRLLALHIQLAPGTERLEEGDRGAVEQFGMALSKELGPRGTTVNQIGPGVTDTDGLVMPADALAHLIAATPAG